MEDKTIVIPGEVVRVLFIVVLLFSITVGSSFITLAFRIDRKLDDMNKKIDADYSKIESQLYNLNYNIGKSLK